MYLGVYPKDHEISRDELVRRWVAEGFVSNCSGLDPCDVAKSYFNELVNRSLIQPAYTDNNIEALYCRVHDMMLDVIIKRCREINFLTVVQNWQAVTEVEDKVRRLFILNGALGDATMPVTSLVSQVRSLAIFEGSPWTPPLAEFSFLRVLFLEFPKHVVRLDLASITQLSQLRYLKLVSDKWSPNASTGSVVLPGQIQCLRHLETLEIPSVPVCSIPSDVVNLPCLSHLVM